MRCNEDGRTDWPVLKTSLPHIYMEDTFRNKLTRKQASKKKLILFELHRSKQGLIFAQMTIVHVSLIANYN